MLKGMNTEVYGEGHPFGDPSWYQAEKTCAGWRSEGEGETVESVPGKARESRDMRLIKLTHLYSSGDIKTWSPQHLRQLDLPGATKVS